MPWFRFGQQSVKESSLLEGRGLDCDNVNKQTFQGHQMVKRNLSPEMYPRLNMFYLLLFVYVELLKTFCVNK